MALLAIELNDAGLAAARPEGLALVASPGFAFVDGDELVTGEAAVVRARTAPRQVNNLFWHRLDTDPLPPPFPARLSHADLAHAHLTELWGRLGAGIDRVILAVPGSRSEAHLSLVLGITRALDIPVTGLADAALTASAGEPGRHFLHLDLELHQAVLSELDQDDGELRRARIELSAQTGLAAITDRLVRKVAELFVLNKRFDPLHAGTTEQLLFDRLPGWLEEIRQEGAATALIEAAATEHAVKLSRAQLAGALAADYDHMTRLVGVLKGRDTVLLLSQRVSGLPGLEEHLAAATGLEVRSLAPGAAALGAFKHRKQIESPGEALPFVTRLTTGAPAAATRAAVPEPEVRGPAPTHLLRGDAAYAITEEPFHLGIAVPTGVRGLSLKGDTAGVSRSHCRLLKKDDRVVVEDLSRYGTFVNGQPVDGEAVLAMGDRLRLGSPGIEFRLIRVLEQGA